jgi:hypothetical protein
MRDRLRVFDNRVEIASPALVECPQSRVIGKFAANTVDRLLEDHAVGNRQRPTEPSSLRSVTGFGWIGSVPKAMLVYGTPPFLMVVHDNRHDGDAWSLGAEEQQGRGFCKGRLCCWWVQAMIYFSE